MGKTEELRQKLIGEMSLTKTLLANRDITESQYQEVMEFLKSELDKCDRSAYVGLDGVARAMQTQSRADISKAYGLDPGYFGGIFSNLIISNDMPVGSIAMVSPPYTDTWRDRYARYRLSENDYKKQVLGKWSDDEPDEDDTPVVEDDTPVVYASSVSVTYDDFTRALTDEESKMFVDAVNKAMEQETAKIFRPQAVNLRERLVGQYGSGAAEILWNEYGGVVLCECDNPDCDSPVNVTHDEYIHASGHGGYYRMTHPDCSYGVLGAKLIERNEKYHVWTKMA